MTTTTDGYMECATCAAKTGAPLLCPACLHNRELVSQLKSALKQRQYPEYEERLTRERDEARASAADAWKHAEGAERERSNTVRERDEARDLYAKSQTALREARHELDAFKREWRERFGFMATKAKPDSIESIDEVACLFNERREQDQADHERRRDERDVAEADAASYRDALIRSNRDRRAYNAEVDRLTTEATRLTEERETLRRERDAWKVQAEGAEAQVAAVHEWGKGIDAARVEVTTQRDALRETMEDVRRVALGCGSDTERQIVLASIIAQCTTALAQAKGGSK